jgi:hypothetical protein
METVFFCWIRPEAIQRGSKAGWDRTEGVSWDGSRRWLRRDGNWESDEFRDPGLQGYELGSRGVELRNWGTRIIECSWVQSWKSGCEEKTLRYSTAIFGVKQWDCYSSCVKIRCQETESGDCNRLTLVFAAVNCKVRRLAVALYVYYL